MNRYLFRHYVWICAVVVLGATLVVALGWGVYFVVSIAIDALVELWGPVGLALVEPCAQDVRR